MLGTIFTKTAGLQLVDGRDFSPEFGADTLACLLNETAVRRMGLKEPIVGSVIQADTNFTVIGVVKDFVFNNPENTIEPMAIFLSKEGFNHFFIQFDNDGQWKSHLAKIESTSKKVFPEYPFEFRFVKDDYQKNFEGIRSTGKMANAFALLAVFISCFGIVWFIRLFCRKTYQRNWHPQGIGGKCGWALDVSFQRFFQTSFIGFCANRSAGPFGPWKSCCRTLNIARSFPGRFLPLQGWWPSEFQSLP
jgi:hypothetical protein